MRNLLLPEKFPVDRQWARNRNPRHNNLKPLTCWGSSMLPYPLVRLRGCLQGSNRTPRDRNHSNSSPRKVGRWWQIAPDVTNEHMWESGVQVMQANYYTWQATYATARGVNSVIPMISAIVLPEDPFWDLGSDPADDGDVNICCNTCKIWLCQRSTNES